MVAVKRSSKAEMGLLLCAVDVTDNAAYFCLLISH